MNSDQIIQKEINIEKAGSCFLESSIHSIDDVAKKTNISRSSVQRYLQEYCIIHPDKKDEIFNKLRQSKQNGLSKGGINSQKNNNYIKDEQGHFQGSKKR